MRLLYSWDKEDARQRSQLVFRYKPDVEGLFLSDRGGQTENQDAWGYAQTADGSLVLAVADGLGGHAGGRAASQAAVRGCLAAALAPDFRGLSDQGFAAMFSGAQAAILSDQAASPDLASMRSTLLALIISEYQIRWGHVGDVRLYLARDSAIVSRTLDQSVPQMLVNAGKLSPADIAHHPDRNRLLQSLGSPESPPRPDLAEAAELEPADFLIISTDGFWEWVDEEHLLRAAQRGAPREAMDEAEALLRDKTARNDHEHDNYTALFMARAKKPEAKGLLDTLKTAFGR
ncbi:MAG: serine/threonine-protein phosphatase [Candidatus Adiutrix sp.]|jgi:serine/threonine protein phosphatase PrpC|nr:serine/threonine-protein phosphatase [Candidatus Adiutrix sp.]